MYSKGPQAPCGIPHWGFSPTFGDDVQLALLHLVDVKGVVVDLLDKLNDEKGLVLLDLGEVKGVDVEFLGGTIAEIIVDILGVVE